jgi:rhodopsin domain-containing protein
MIWLSVLPFFTSLYFCKFALLATYMQLFPTFMKPLRIALYATIAFCICGYIVSMSSHIFMCWPVEGNW